MPQPTAPQAPERPSAGDPRPMLQVDIVSDVVCPWCIIGFLQLDRALAATGTLARLRWHPFELNPDMPPEGQNLREHIIQKYGTSAEDSDAARDRLTALGRDLGFAFNFTPETRMHNTFRAHQLLDWAEQQGRQHPLKRALFAAHFTDNRPLDDPATLAAIAGQAGLDPQAAAAALASGAHAGPVRAKQRFWLDRGIRGVPAMVFAGKYLVTGAQGAETYETLIRRCLAEAA